MKAERMVEERMGFSRIQVARLLVQWCLVLFCIGYADTSAESAEIRVLPPQEPTAIFGTASFIFIEGEIDESTPRKLEELILRDNIFPYSSVQLNSPGGNLFAGMELGRVIRKHGFTTSIGRWAPPRKGLDDIKPGLCFSACTLAFLGGNFRYFSDRDGDRFGVHRFYSEGEMQNGMDVGQIASAAITAYLTEMEVNVGFFEMTTRAGAENIYEPSLEELEAVNAVNNGIGTTSWTVESNAGALYLKGERETSFGVNKFMVLCVEKRLVLYIVFDPQGREAEAKSFPVHSLVIDGEPSDIKPDAIEIQNNWYNGFYSLSKKNWKRIASAKTVGVMLQVSRDAPVFLGFDSMPFEQGREKFRGLVSNCQ